MPLYDIYLLNRDLRGEQEADARRALISRFKLTEEQADRLLMQERALIKQGVEADSADAMRQALEDCGYQAEVVPHQGAAAAQTVEESSPESSQQALFCAQCAFHLPPQSDRCPRCGSNRKQVGGRSKVAAGFLALFLGGLGIHRFYLRQWWGALYIPFGLFLVAWPVALVEAIYFWACPRERWQRKYGELPPSSPVIWVVAGLVPIAFVGMLAAVAVPAYQDYVYRARVAEGLHKVLPYRNAVAEIAIETDSLPGSNAEVDLEVPAADELNDVQLQTGAEIVISFAPPKGDAMVYTIVLSPEVQTSSDDITAVNWNCNGGTLPDKYRPPRCRGETGSVSRSYDNAQVIRSSHSGARLVVPASWNEGIVGNPEATIEAGNVFRETYVLLIEEQLPPDNTISLDQYRDALTNIYSDAMPQFRLRETSPLVSDSGLEGILVEFSSVEQGLAITWLMGLYRQDGDYYQVLSWTLTEDFERNSETLRDVVQSLAVE